jgi:hypothetical protein
MDFRKKFGQAVIVLKKPKKKKAKKLPPPKNIPIIETREEIINGEVVQIRVAKPAPEPKKPAMSMKCIKGRGRHTGLKGQNK